MNRVRMSPAGYRWAFVAVGILLRLVQWARDPSVWHDEAALLLNVVYLDLSECFGKLLYHEASPPLFLALERVTLLAIGDSGLAMRAPVVLVGCVSVVLFSSLVGRILTPWPAALAVALFAVSDRLIWHSIEAKPYALDVFLAILTAWGYVRTRDLPLRIQCASWIAVLPVAEWFTFPGCFIAGGLLVALMPAARKADWPDRGAYALLGLAVVGWFVALALGPAKAQQDGAMMGCWVNHFADWSHPASVPFWIIASTPEVLRYALLPFGQILVPVAVVGAIRLGRRDGRLLTVLLAPLGLSLVAALMGKYPYGGARVSVFAAPALIAMIAEGVPPSWEWLRRQWRFAPFLLGVALAIPFAQTVFRTAVPWPRADFREAVAYVDTQFRDGDLIVADHWEVLYYTRGREEQVCQLPEVAERKPSRIWILTGTDPGVGDVRLRDVPPDWQQVDSRTFHGTIAVLFEHRPAPAASTSAGGTIP